MALSGAAAEAERVLTVGLARADANVQLRSKAGRAVAREVLEMLERANEELRRRLEREAQRFGPTERFTGAGLLAYQRQVEFVAGYVRGRLDGLSRREMRRNIREGWFGTVATLGGLEEAFSGSVRPLRIDSARMMNERTRGVRATLLQQHATSMDRYGEKLVREMREALQTNLLAGGTFSQAVDQLVAGRGPRGWVSMVARELGDGTVERIRLERIPEGLFRRYRYWAMRIVRTETAYAQNGAAFEAIRASRDEDFPDMQKKILAMMDARTYPDSIAVHGQIRDVDALFVDGAGREYLHPPARPNDREVVIPWRPRWSEVPASRPSSLEEAVARARARGQAPNLADVPLHERLELDREFMQAHRLGGAGEKSVLRDPVTGRRYIFKPSTQKGTGRIEPFRARAQVAISQIARRVRPDHIEIEYLERDGVPGTLQPLLELAHPPDLGGLSPGRLSPAEMRQLAMEHVIDWATSQHDSHSRNFIRTADGRLLGIDKEQGWRYFGSDRLSTSYHPNERYGEEEPYYNRFWRSFAAGEVEFDPLVMREAFDALEGIEPHELEAILRPYAASRSTSRADQDAFISRAQTRIYSTRDAFGEFIEGLYQEREGPGTFDWSDGWRPAPPSGLTSSEIEAATEYARGLLREGVTPVTSRHALSGSRTTGGLSDVLHALRRRVGSERVGEFADALIARWAGQSSDGAAALAMEALGRPPGEAAVGYWPKPEPGVAPEDHHRSLLRQGAAGIDMETRYYDEGRRATVPEAVDAAIVQIATTRALLEHEGISRPGQVHTVRRGLNFGRLAATARADAEAARAAGRRTFRVPGRALVSASDPSEAGTSTATGAFGRTIIEYDVTHEQIFSHYRIDGELLSGEGEIVTIHPEGYIEVDVDRIFILDD